MYVTDTGTVRKISPSGDVTTVAGTPGEFGNAATGGNDGAGAAARFNVLSSITVGSDGYIYVTDTVTNEGKIRRITQQGVVTTLADEIYGLGITADGNGNVYFTNNYEAYVGVIRLGEAPSVLTRLRAPRGITVDNAGNLYVTNTGLDYGPLGQTTYSCTIDRISPSGQVTTLAGAVAPREFESTCSTIDGSREGARIGNAHGIAVDSAGNVYFTEIQSHTVRRISPDGTVTTIAGSMGNRGASDGTGTAARFNDPRGITIGRDGNLYVADTGNHTIRKVTPQGVVTTVAGKAGESGSADVPDGSATPTSPPATEPPPSGSTGDTPSPGSTTPTMVTVSTIRGTFNGWRNTDLLIELTNGQVWRQAEYHYEYHYAYMPDVIVYQSGGQYLMQVEGTDRAVAVVRVQ